MRLPTDDRTARAIIRDEALRLFAEYGPDAVTVRGIASAADVSPALVLRHYGSKDGLREAVDEHVVRVFQAMLDRVAVPDAVVSDTTAAAGLAELVARELPESSPLPRYVARMLIGDGHAAAALFERLHRLAGHALDRLVAAGAAHDGGDRAARAAVLLANDLAVIMLRDRLREVLGTDPLSADGVRRWGRQVLAIYSGGLAAVGRNDDEIEVRHGR